MMKRYDDGRAVEAGAEDSPLDAAWKKFDERARADTRAGAPAGASTITRDSAGSARFTTDQPAHADAADAGDGGEMTRLDRAHAAAARRAAADATAGAPKLPTTLTR